MFQRSRLRGWYISLAFFAFVWIGWSVPLHAQTKTPPGEPTVNVVASGLYKLVGTNREFILNEGHASQLTGNWYYTRSQSWKAPAGRDIVGFDLKKGNIDVVFILLDDGSVYETTYNNLIGWSPPSFRSKTDVSGNYSGFTKLVGDALYSLSITGVFVSRDTARSWALDTLGVGTGLYYDIAIDSLQYVYLAHGTGLFKQHPDSSIWHKVSSIPAGTVVSVFVDRKNRIYASTYGGVYLSTNGGGSWNPKITGFTGGYVTHFGDDAFHNVYALGGGMVFRSDSGSAAWVRIDTSISKLIHDPISSYSPPFNAISGDTVLFLATSYGLFESTDHGNTWNEDNGNNQATTLYGYARSSTREFVTTNLGLFYEGLADTAWTKAFPSKGYQTGGPIYADNTGTLYTLGTIININNSQSPNTNWKSTDNGTTWLPDTSGLGALAAGSIPKYFADETGTQHYAVSGVPAKCYKKSSGSPWTPDTIGWGLLRGNYPNIITSDMRGNIYAAITTTTDYTGLLLRRPLAGGSWVLDTAGLNKAIVYSLTPDQSSNLYAGTWGGGIYKRTGSTWSSVPLPPGQQGNSAFVTAMDHSGALFAGFASQSGFNYAWHGVYYTTNNGSSWTFVGLDSIAVKALIAYGDSVYAATYYDGLYVLTRTGATAVNQTSAATPNSYALLQNYPNPFNPTTTIRFSLAQRGRVSLKIFDILGREIATLVNGELDAGLHQATFDATRFASGVYFYRLQAGNFTATRKLVLLK